MIVTLARGLSSRFIAIGVIKKEDRAIYDYSFQLLLMDILNIVVLILLSAIAGKILETILYMISFMYLRSIGGGYHASTHLRCFLTMLLVYSAFLATLFLLPLQYYIHTTIISFFISLIVVFRLAPATHVNRPLNTKEKLALAKKSRLTAILYVVATLSYTALSKETSQGLTVGLSMLSVSGSMIVAALTPKREEKCEKG
jgi:accessory gene regulator B